MPHQLHDAFVRNTDPQQLVDLKRMVIAEGEKPSDYFFHQDNVLDYKYILDADTYLIGIEVVLST